MADGVTPPRPVNPKERIDAIDVLRGLALLGVLAINVVMEFRVSIFEQFLFPKPPASPIDSVVGTILTLAVESKHSRYFRCCSARASLSSSSGLQTAGAARCYSCAGSSC